MTLAKRLVFFESQFGKPTGFTSPGFKSDERVMRLVEDLGFRYNGDAIGGKPERARANSRELNHWTIPVTICGPRTIPFLEWHGARHTDEQSIIRELDEFLVQGGLVILYGHPCYEGVHIKLLKSIFEHVLNSGFKFVTHADVAERLSNGELLVH